MLRDTETQISQYGKHPILNIKEKDSKEDDKPIISFGLKKAQAILASIDSIKKFVDSNGKEK